MKISTQFAVMKVLLKFNDTYIYIITLISDLFLSPKLLSIINICLSFILILVQTHGTYTCLKCYFIQILCVSCQPYFVFKTNYEPCKPHGYNQVYSIRHKDYCLLGCDILQFGTLTSTFCRNIPPASSIFRVEEFALLFTLLPTTQGIQVLPQCSYVSKKLHSITCQKTATLIIITMKPSHPHMHVHKLISNLQR